MTRLGRASVFLAVFAGGYAILMLINGQLTDFGVSAGVCAVALPWAALFAWRAGYGRAPAALPAAVVSTLEPHVSEEVLDSGVGDGPEGFAAQSGRKACHITNFGDRTLSVVDRITNSVATTVDVPGHPEAVALSPDGERIYVGGYWSGAVAVISVPTVRDPHTDAAS
jgi:YVTN family beta-propeller protein